MPKRADKKYPYYVKNKDLFVFFGILVLFTCFFGLTFVLASPRITLYIFQQSEQSVINNDYFIPAIPSEQKRKYKDLLSRLRHYIRWLDLMGLSWFYPDIDGYIDYLISLGTFQPATIRAHISSVRMRYVMLSISPTIFLYLISELQGDMEEFKKKVVGRHRVVDDEQTKIVLLDQHGRLHERNGRCA